MPKLRRQFFYAIVLSLLLTTGLATAQESVPLPVKKVELYKNGMGFFEHMGTVKGQQNIEISLTSSQLNDVLKSLTVLDLSGGRISGVAYDSTAPLNRRLAELPIDLNSQTNLVDILNQIRGTSIETRTPGGVVSGKLLGAEFKTGMAGQGVAIQETFLSLLAPSGEIQIVRLESAGALKFTDPTMTADLARYLDVVNSAHQRDVRKLRIQTNGTGERQIYLGYTSESPIWKTTYRIVLDPTKKALLQGWAIVDNTTQMDWLGVSLSLTAGAPISFVQDLSQPLYARRPIVSLPEGIQAAPQTYEGTIEDDSANQRQTEMADLTRTARMAGSPGVARGAGSVSDFKSKSLMAPVDAELGRAAAPAPPPPSISDAVRQQTFQAAQTKRAADQFVYKIPQPVTIKRNESALIPIIQSEMEGEKVAVYQGSANEEHPRLAFWLKNSSGIVLDAGPITLIDANSFAGEGLIETVQPGESRLLSYAVDLGTEISTLSGTESRRVERAIVKRGMLRLFSKYVEKKTYKIRNNNESTRTIVIEHQTRPNWKLLEPKPVESSANYYRFKVEAKPKSTVDFVVQEESPIESSFAISSVTPEQIAIWVRDRSIDPEVENALQSIAEKKASLDDLSRKISALDREQNDIFKDQERVRGNLNRLAGTPEEANLRQRYIKQLESQENRLAEIKSEREKIESARTTAQQQLDDQIIKINLDKKI